jgi:SAM-dependent methyltransferase
MASSKAIQLAYDLRAAGVVLGRSGDVDLARGAFRQRRTSREAFDGFVAGNPLRAWEYAWVMQQVAKHGSGSGTAVDFGAGKSPIPILLSRLGYTTSVVDSDQLEGEYANEWEWIDYGKWDVRTHRAGMQDRLFEEGSLSVAVSVSAIEHMPAVDRRKAITEIVRATRRGGVVVVTIDVLPDGKHLWNLAVDELEPIEVHGTVDTFVAELLGAGLQMVTRKACPLKSGDQLVEAFVLSKET